MQSLDDLRAFANSAAHPLHRAETHVADGEYAGHARLQRVFIHWLISRAPCARDHKTVLIHLDPAAREPRSGGVGTDEQEDVANGGFRFRAGGAIAPAHT